MKKFYITTIFLILFAALFDYAFANEVWINDLRTLYSKGNAVIYGINIRTFAANDINGDGIIEENLGEEKGNFLNAIDRLDDLERSGINVINLLPILPVGKTKALGTAGSLYSPSAFDKLNPQLKASGSQLSVETEAKKFINECHKRHIRVIIDLPAGASFDFYKNNPNLVLKNGNQQPLYVSEFSDTVFLDGGNSPLINRQVFTLYRNFIDMVINLGADGVKICSPEIKPKEFWQKLISETRLTQPQFLFMADNQNRDIFNNAGFKTLSVNELLESGFDGYFNNFDQYNKWNNANELYSLINKDINISKKYGNTKKAAANFVTHMQQSPILYQNGKSRSEMIIWLQSTLPVNSYYIDGFMTGDTYIYPYGNKKAETSETDDLKYFVNRGKIDIYNYSRMPYGAYKDLKRTFVLGNTVKHSSEKYEQNGVSVKIHRTDNSNVFAYERVLDKVSILVVGNLDFNKDNSASFKIDNAQNNKSIIPITDGDFPTIKEDKFSIELKPGEVFAALLITLQKK